MVECIQPLTIRCLEETAEKATNLIRKFPREPDTIPWALGMVGRWVEVGGRISRAEVEEEGLVGLAGSVVALFNSITLSLAVSICTAISGLYLTAKNEVWPDHGGMRPSWFRVPLLSVSLWRASDWTDHLAYSEYSECSI